MANGLDIQPDDIAVVSFYADASQIPDFAVPAIAAATERQMVVNYPQLNRLNPNKTATRAEVAAFVYQALAYSGKPPHTGTDSSGTNSTQTPVGVVDVVQTVVPPSRVGEPNGVFVSIIDFLNVDGQSITVGQPIEIRATARDSQGSDLSSTIVWTSSGGQVLGRGSNLTFRSTEMKFETLTATATSGNGQTNKARVTIGISPSDIITPSGVKPLPDTAIIEEPDSQRSLITDITGIPGRICFTNDRAAWGRARTMPTLKVGDVMLGASGAIPPVKILKVLPAQSDQSCVETEFAAIEEFFPKRKDGKPFDLPSLIAPEDRTLRFNPDGTNWVAINTSIPSNIGRPLPGIGFPPVGFNPKEEVEVGPGVKYPSSPTGKLNSLPTGTGPNIKPAQGWPEYLTNCVVKEYSKRYELAKQKAIDKSFDQSSEGQTTNLDYPFDPAIDSDPAIDRPVKPENIIPPEKYRYTFDLKSVLEEKEPIRTVTEAPDRKKSERFKSKTKVEHKQKLELLAYLGLNFNARIPENERSFTGLNLEKPDTITPKSLADFTQSVIGFANGDFFNFSMRIKIDEMLMGGIAMDGLYQLDTEHVQPIQTGFEGVGAYRIFFVAGIVPVWVDFPLLMDMRVIAKGNVGYREGVIGFLQNGYGDFTFNFASGGSTSITNIDKKSIVGSNFCGRSDMNAFAEVRLEPRIQVLLYSLMGPELGIQPYARLTADHPQTVLSIVEPQQSTNQSPVIRPNQDNPVKINQGNEVRLTAVASNTVSIPLNASAGVDFAMTPAIVQEDIVRKAPYATVNIGQVCLPEEIKKLDDKLPAEISKYSSKVTGWIADKVPCSKPYNKAFDPNLYLREKFTFRKNLVNKQKDITADFPIVEPGSPIFQGLFKNATLIWTSEKTNETIAASNPNSPVTLDKCSLPSGLQNLKVEAFSPFDSQLKQPLGKAYISVMVEPSEGCNSPSP